MGYDALVESTRDVLDDSVPYITMIEDAMQYEFQSCEPNHDNSTEVEGPAYPPLPSWAQVDDKLANSASPTLDAMIEFSRRMSPRGYEDFHEATSIWLLSVIAARRIVLQLGTKSFYPSLYIALAAFTSIWAKSTTALVAQQILQQLELGYLLTPNESTPQAFFKV